MRFKERSMEVVAYVKIVSRDLEVTNRFVTVVLHNHVVQNGKSRYA